MPKHVDSEGLHFLDTLDGDGVQKMDIIAPCARRWQDWAGAKGSGGEVS